MIVEIKREDSPEDVQEKLQQLFHKQYKNKKNHLDKYFGILKLDIDPVVLQRRWRDE